MASKRHPGVALGRGIAAGVMMAVMTAILGCAIVDRLPDYIPSPPPTTTTTMPAPPTCTPPPPPALPEGWRCRLVGDCSWECTPPPSPVPTPTPTPVPTPTPTPPAGPACSLPPPGPLCQGTDPAGWCGGCYTCRDDNRWKQHNKACSDPWCEPKTGLPRNAEDPASCSTCLEKQAWEVRQGNWHWSPSGAPYVVWGCPPGVPDVLGCAGIKHLDKECNRVDATGRILAPWTDGYFGNLCHRCPEPSPTPTPTPTPTPSASPSAPPQPGVKCAPLARTGVSLHSRQDRPRAPRGIRWVFSSTPKAEKPYCPDHRNECEQQAYEGDPVGDYDAVRWRFDLRFECQDQRGPLWVQWEPHTGDAPQPVDVQHTNAYNANLVPAVPGLHRVRTCPQGTADYQARQLPHGCGETTAVAP